jgi:hypothetical protein
MAGGNLKSLKRIIAGKKSHAKGKDFEKFIEDALSRQGWLVVRIPDGCKQIAAKQVVRVPSPFDFLLLKNDVAIFMDAKRTEGPKIPKNLFSQDQIDWFKKINHRGFLAGFIVHVESTDDLLWIRHDLSVGAAIGTFPNIDFNLHKISLSVSVAQGPSIQLDPQLEK